jgi:hypothetical protein
MKVYLSQFATSFLLYLFFLSFFNIITHHHRRHLPFSFAATKTKFSLFQVVRFSFFEKKDVHHIFTYKLEAYRNPLVICIGSWGERETIVLIL